MKIQSGTFFRAGHLALFFFALLTALVAQEAASRLTAGSKLESLTVGKNTYQNVLVRSVSARSAMITHSSGMTSILLRDLSPELQQRFGYNPAAEHAQDEVAKAGQ